MERAQPARGGGDALGAGAEHEGGAPGRSTAATACARSRRRVCGRRRSGVIGAPVGHAVAAAPLASLMRRQWRMTRGLQRGLERLRRAAGARCRASRTVAPRGSADHGAACAAAAAAASTSPRRSRAAPPLRAPRCESAPRRRRRRPRRPSPPTRSKRQRAHPKLDVAGCLPAEVLKPAARRHLRRDLTVRAAARRASPPPSPSAQSRQGRWRRGWRRSARCARGAAARRRRRRGARAARIRWRRPGRACRAHASARRSSASHSAGGGGSRRQAAVALADACHSSAARRRRAVQRVYHLGGREFVGQASRRVQLGERPRRRAELKRLHRRRRAVEAPRQRRQRAVGWHTSLANAHRVLADPAG